MTFLVLTDDTHKIIPRSSVRTALDSADRNKILDPINFEDIFSGPKPENPIIYDRYNDDVTSEDGETEFVNEFEDELSVDSEDSTILSGNTSTYVWRFSQRLRNKKKEKRRKKIADKNSAKYLKKHRRKILEKEQRKKNKVSSEVCRNVVFPKGTKLE